MCVLEVLSSTVIDIRMLEIIISIAEDQYGKFREHLNPDKHTLIVFTNNLYSNKFLNRILFEELAKQTICSQKN